MDRSGARRAVREAGLLGIAVVVLVVCLLVAGAALISPWASALGATTDNACFGESEPSQVRADRGESEGSLPTASRSLLPYGPVCTWTLSDGSQFAKQPSWGPTVALMGAAVGVAGALALGGVALRRSNSAGQ